MRRTASALLAPILLVVGCGDDGGGGSDGVPSCSEVWVEGERLPKGYAGCLDGGMLVVPELIPCQDADVRWTTYDGRLAAVLGEEIFSVSEPGDDSDAYSSIMLSC